MSDLKFLDLKFVPCPLNIVKIKLTLEKLSKNQELIVEVDKGEPEEMVQQTLNQMGYSLKLIEKNQSSIKIKISHDN